MKGWLPSPFLRLSAGLHVGALAAVAAAPRLWPGALALLAADHLVAGAAGLVPRSRLLGPNLRRLPAAAAARGEVGLTFDDGPDPEATPAVLELLARRGARASFFAVGRRAAAHPDLAAEIVRRGHRLENHTWSHPKRFALLGPRAALAEIDRAQEALAGIAGAPPAYFRAPAGLRSPWLAPPLARRGLTLASWTRRGYDTVTADPARVAARLTRGLAAGDVLVLHDGGSAQGSGGRPVVLDALERVLDALAAAGLSAVALPAPGRRPR
jgi:peptidoglycan/xylan/chitin deacetylase (PgdA/CDA1 family)